MVHDGPVEATRTQPGKIGECRASTGHDHDVRARERARIVDEPHSYIRFEAQGVDIGEITDARQHHDSDGERTVAGVARTRCQCEGIFGVQPQIALPRQHPEHRAPGQHRQRVQARFQQSGIAAELVDHEAAYQLLIGGIEERERAVHRREDPTAVDVTDENRRK